MAAENFSLLYVLLQKLDGCRGHGAREKQGRSMGRGIEDRQSEEVSLEGRDKENLAI
jgi:hypothetical protein